MLAMNAYYNGTNIVLDKVDMIKGQRMTVVFEPIRPKRKALNLDKYDIETERGKNVDEYMREMRSDDRI